VPREEGTLAHGGCSYIQGGWLHDAGAREGARLAAHVTVPVRTVRGPVMHVRLLRQRDTV
jgi:hypothetical protein